MNADSGLVIRPRLEGQRRLRACDPYKGLLESRELGQGSDSWRTSEMNRRLYKGFAVHELGAGKASMDNNTGGIFNLEFNADGTILAVACEQKSIHLFDPSTRKLVQSVEKAHDDGVNCIKFLDNRSFATCSDDTTVALWDARYLKHRVRTLRGHTNWVKNIEFSHRENCLVTSGLDGTVCLWDINKYSENGDQVRRIFRTNGLMRMRIDNHGEKMVISTMNGYLIVIHDLSLEDLEKDLEGFKPNMYRLLQMSGGKAISGATAYTHLFHTCRNRIEFISDFPNGNEAEFISSLKLHPQGWVAVSRNVSANEDTEWCCVHDIHAPPPDESEDHPLSSQPEIERAKEPQTNRTSNSSSAAGLSRLAEFLYDASTSSRQDNERNQARQQSEPQQQEQEERSSPSSSSASTSDNNSSASERIHFSSTFRINPNSTISFSVDNARGRPSVRISSSEIQSQSRELLGELLRRQRAQRNQNEDRVSNEQDGDEERPQNQGGEINVSEELRNNFGPRQGIFMMARGRAGSGGNWVYFGTSREQRSNQAREGAKICHNKPRLTHFIEESNAGRGYIKEISFSPDGLIFCSPFDCGIRLLGFNDALTDMSLFPPMGDPRPLSEVSVIPDCHRDVVLTSAFSPNSYQLVTGCLAGGLVWHQPRL